MLKFPTLISASYSTTGCSKMTEKYFQMSDDVVSFFNSLIKTTTTTALGHACIQLRIPGNSVTVQRSGLTLLQ
jgi:hypothetical protein